jgi:cytochrome b pre-mRNA-processing protein 3
MLYFFQKRSQLPFELYYQVVDQARCPVFYERGCVPDTPLGRFDMVTLHLYSLFDHLKKAGQRGENFAQEVSDVFWEETDRALREMGVGDTSVPKRIKALAGRFYAHSERYYEAGENPDKLEAALKRNLWPEDTPEAGCIIALAQYILLLKNTLTSQPIEKILKSNMVWPDLQTIQNLYDQAERIL